VVDPDSVLAEFVAVTAPDSYRAISRLLRRSLEGRAAVPGMFGSERGGKSRRSAVRFPVPSGVIAQWVSRRSWSMTLAESVLKYENGGGDVRLRRVQSGRDADALTAALVKKETETGGRKDAPKPCASLRLQAGDEKDEKNEEDEEDEKILYSADEVRKVGSRGKAVRKVLRSEAPSLPSHRVQQARTTRDLWGEMLHQQRSEERKQGLASPPPFILAAAGKTAPRRRRR